MPVARLLRENGSWVVSEGRKPPHGFVPIQFTAWKKAVMARRSRKSRKKPSRPATEAQSPLAGQKERGLWQAIKSNTAVIRNRILSGLFLALPFLVTFIIIQWLYQSLAQQILEPLARRVLAIWEESPGNVQLPEWITNFLAPMVAIMLVLSFLFLLGMFFRSRLHRLLDWLFLQVPFVSTIYSSVLRVIEVLQRSSDDERRFQRVVLVSFPHPGMRVPAFVTSSCKDRLTQRVILCVYVPTTPVPTSGYMLLVPEEEVVELSWDVRETIQAIVSGGITVPDEVDYFRDLDDAQAPNLPPGKTPRSPNTKPPTPPGQ